MSIFSYDATSREYVYNGFRAGGTYVTLRGTEENGRWVLQSEGGKGAERVRNRVTIEPNRQGSFNFLSEASTDDAPWKEQAKIAYIRVAQ